MSLSPSYHLSLIIVVCVSVLKVCVWQELQSVRTTISSLEKQKKYISDTVRALVVGAECIPTIFSLFSEILRDEC